MHGEESSGTVTKEASENDTDYATAVVDRRRAEEGIDRGSNAILSRPVDDADTLLGQKHMTVWGGNVDAPMLERHAIFSDQCGERSLPIKDIAQESR